MSDNPQQVTNPTRVPSADWVLLESQELEALLDLEVSLMVNQVKQQLHQRYDGRDGIIGEAFATLQIDGIKRCAEILACIVMELWRVYRHSESGLFMARRDEYEFQGELGEVLLKIRDVEMDQLTEIYQDEVNARTFIAKPLLRPADPYLNRAASRKEPAKPIPFWRFMARRRASR